MPRLSAVALATLTLTAACARAPGSFACGTIYLAGATMLLDEFARERTALSLPPAGLPERLAARLAAGPAYRALVGYADDSTIVVGVEGALPEGTEPGFGVLTLGADGRARGVMIYPGRPVAGAPVIGLLTVGEYSVPLIGLQTDVTGLENPDCPFFPEEYARP
jgi:hypothetical protein